MSANNSSVGHPQQEKANLHPGHIILDAQNKRHTPAEKTADDLHAKEVKSAHEAALQQGCDQVQEMEATMAVMQSMKQVVRAKLVKPRLRVRQGRPTSINTTPHVDDGEYKTYWPLAGF